MLLSDRGILAAMSRGDLAIEPMNNDDLQPASVDLHLSDLFRIPRNDVKRISVRDVFAGHTELVRGDMYDLGPGAFLLGSTLEHVTVGARVAGNVEGISSLGRLGLAVHVTAGFVDPGFEGQITLEIHNAAPWTIELEAGMRICQIAFHDLGEEVQRPYGKGGHYQNQIGPVESKYCFGRTASDRGLRR